MSSTGGARPYTGPLRISLKPASRPLKLSINAEDEEALRAAEKLVDMYYARYSEKFPDADAADILAYVALHLAAMYKQASFLAEQAQETLERVAALNEKLRHISI